MNEQQTDQKGELHGELISYPYTIVAAVGTIAALAVEVPYQIGIVATPSASRAQIYKKF